MVVKKFDITNKILFLVGLAFFLIGQLILSQGNDFVYNQEPVDFAHWFFIGRSDINDSVNSGFSKKNYGLIGIPLTLIGIVCIIGMCLLDFIWWSFPNEELRNEFTNHISQVPSIWKPFVTIGPSSKIFNLGLLILSLNYIENGKLGIILVFIANLILWQIIPLPFRLVSGYALTLIGFSIILLKEKNKNVL